MKLKITNRTFEGEVPKLTKWLYTSSGMFRDACYQFVSMFLLTFVQFCGLGGVSFSEYLAMFGVVSIIVIILRIWDGVNDPIMGFIIEKCHFKSGKYRPWIIIGALANSIVTICMFWILPTGWAYVICFALFYFLWDFTYTINDISFWSVLPSLSNNEKVRATLTTNLSIFISIGTFVVGGVVPMLASGNQQAVYQTTAIVTSVLFLLSQLILVIFMKEKKVDETTAKNDENIKFKDIFTVLVKNDQLRASIIAIILYYTGSGVLVAGGLNYFYFSFGYGEGGNYQFIFTVVFAISTFAAQFLFPVLKNKLKMSKLKLFSISSIVTICAYILLFLFVFVPDYITFFPVLCACAFIAFFGQTINSLILYIMIQDTIDYNEYKFNERRESATFALRAFAAKMAGSIQQGVLYLFLAASSLLAVSNQIANWERDPSLNSSQVIENANGVTGIANVELWQRVVFQVGFAVVPMLLFLGTYLVIKFKYKITEEKHEEMIKAIEERKKSYEQ